MRYRFTVTGPELIDEDWSNNELEGSIVVEDSQVNTRLTSIGDWNSPFR